MRDGLGSSFCRWIVAGLLVLLAASAGAAEEPPYRVPPEWVAYRTVMARFDSLEASGRRADAASYLDSLVTAARERGDRTHLVQTLVRRGGTRVFRGAYESGEPDLREALAAAEAIRDTLGQIIALQYLAYGVGERSAVRQSRPLWTRMLALSRARGDRSHAGWALMGLAYSDYREGRGERAIPLYLRSIAEMEACGDVTGLLEARIGYVNSLPDGSPQVPIGYRQLIDDARRHGRAMAEGAALHNLAGYELQRGDPELALELFGRSEQAFARTSSSLRWSAVLSRAIVLQDLGRHEACAAIVEPLAATALRTHNWKLAVSALATLSDARDAQGRAATADSLRRRVLVMADSVDARDVAGTVFALGHSLVARGRPAEALASVDRYVPRHSGDATSIELNAACLAADALVALGRPQDALARLRDVSALASDSDASGEDIALHLMLATTWRALDQPDSVLAHMRRARGQWLSRRLRPRNFLMRELRGSGARWFAGTYLGDVLAAPTAGPAALRPHVAFDELQGFKARTLAERLSRRASAAEEEQARHPVTLTTLQSRVLREGEVFLDVHVGQTRSVLFAVTRRSLQFVLLPGSDVLELRDQRLAELAANPASDRAVVTEALRAAATALLGRAAPTVLAARLVVISADRSTFDLPWAALLDAAAPSPDRDVALAPSASWFAAARARARAPVDGGLLALAGSVNGRGDRLEGAEREVRWLASTYASVTTELAGRSRSAEALAPQLARYPVLHLAGHATQDEREPWRAGIRLGAGDAPEDYLRAGGIARQRLPVRLAVLSACRSIGSSGHFGEGVLGLASGFLAAGTQSVVATLWPVSDATAEAFAHAFYPALARGATVAAAVRAAQLALRAVPATSATADWGAFVLVGHPDGRVSLRPRLVAAKPRAVAG